MMEKEEINLTGSWKGTCKGLTATPHSVTDPTSGSKVHFTSADITLIIREQFENRIAGHLTGSEATIIAGVIDQANDEVKIAAGSGLIDGTVMADGTLYVAMRASGGAPAASAGVLTKEPAPSK